MIETTAMILESLRSYASPADKLTRLVRAGEYTPIIKGLYVTDEHVPGYLLAGSIYGPSYLSFEFALAFHGLIPEAVYGFTSATFEKRKMKRYETAFGVFTYRDVPSSVYSYGIEIRNEREYSYLLASPEKALCDQLYKMKPVTNYKELENLLFDDLRIEEHEFRSLSFNDLAFLAEKYGSTNIKKLKGFIRRL